MNEYNIYRFPKTRIATRDVFWAGKKKHHVIALLEADVTGSLARISQLKKEGSTISFTAWLIKLIACTIQSHPTVAAYAKGRRGLVLFKNINVSLIVEKELEGKKIPIPLVIAQADEKSISAITEEIRQAKESPFTKEDIVLHKKTQRAERVYYLLPGFIRRLFWKYLLKHPQSAFGKMGNVAFTSIGMMGAINGWFIPASVHPVCFGIGAIIKKPVVLHEEIVIRDILNMTFLLDHDVMDGAPMARFVKELVEGMGNAACL
jgi:pyruvate/2-oxoglutarate dehydrogenase complex dihydrolipoamide acyltransferase (E2) component